MRVTSANRAALDDAAWALAQRLGEFGYAEIAADIGINMRQAGEMIRRWEAQGRCVHIRGGECPRNRLMFRIRPEACVQRPALKGSVPLNLWTAMRGLKSFTPTDLAAHATVDEVVVGVPAAQAYCQALLRAGYLRVERTAVPGRREAIYRLIKVTGPRPPRERRVKAVYDENLRQIVHVSGGEP